MLTVIPNERVFLYIGGADASDLYDDVMKCGTVDFFYLFFREKTE